MGEEGTNVRLNQLESATKDIKASEDKNTERIIAIEKSNIRQEIILSQILATYNVIKYLFLAFIISNVGMYFLKNH